MSSNLAPTLIQDKLAAYVGGPDQPRMANGFLYNPALANTLRVRRLTAPLVAWDCPSIVDP